MQVVAIDAGGTRTNLVVADGYGRIVRQGMGGSGNQNVAGLDALRRSVCDAAGQAGLGSPPFGGVDCVVAGLSGVDGPDGARDAEACLGPLFPGAALRAVPDIDIALRASFDTGIGVVVVAGTGAMAYGYDGKGGYACASGWGPMVGDEGSAYFIGRQGIGAALKAYDGRGPATSLLPALLASLGEETRQGIVSVLYGQGWGVPEVAAFAQEVSTAAMAGDAVATGIVGLAAEELAAAAVAVLSQLGMVERPMGVALAGGLVAAGPALLGPARQALTRSAPLAVLVKPRWPSILGAVIMALEELGIAWAPELIGLPSEVKA